MAPTRTRPFTQNQTTCHYSTQPIKNRTSESWFVLPKIRGAVQRARGGGCWAACGSCCEHTAPERTRGGASNSERLFRAIPTSRHRFGARFNEPGAAVVGPHVGPAASTPPPNEPGAVRATANACSGQSLHRGICTDVLPKQTKGPDRYRQ